VQHTCRQPEACLTFKLAEQAASWQFVNQDQVSYGWRASAYGEPCADMHMGVHPCHACTVPVALPTLPLLLATIPAPQLLAVLSSNVEAVTLTCKTVHAIVPKDAWVLLCSQVAMHSNAQQLLKIASTAEHQRYCSSYSA
jgi:hypothetical protein